MCNSIGTANEIEALRFVVPLILSSTLLILDSVSGSYLFIMNFIPSSGLSFSDNGNNLSDFFFPSESLNKNCKDLHVADTLPTSFAFRQEEMAFAEAASANLYNMDGLGVDIT